MSDAQVIEDAATELQLLAEGDASPRLSWTARQASAMELARRTLQGASPRRMWQLATLAAMQSKLIFPGRRTQGTADAQFEAPAGAELCWMRGPRGDRVAGLFGRAMSADGTVRDDYASLPTILFFYGNDMWLACSLDPFDLLRRCGANVLMPEFLGFGLSDGRACEAGCYETADAAWDYLRKRKDIDSSRVVVSGASLGGAVAIDLASRVDVGGLITLVTFSSLPDVAKHTHPHLPIWRLIRHRFESEKKMPRVRCPAMIIHSPADQLIPYEMANRLAAAAGGPVRRLDLEGATHKSTEMLDRREILTPAVCGFLGDLFDL